MQALLRGVQCVHSPVHLVESASCLLHFNELWEQKLMNNFSYCLQNIGVKLVLFFDKINEN